MAAAARRAPTAVSREGPSQAAAAAAAAVSAAAGAGRQQQGGDGAGYLAPAGSLVEVTVKGGSRLTLHRHPARALGLYGLEGAVVLQAAGTIVQCETRYEDGGLRAWAQCCEKLGLAVNKVVRFERREEAREFVVHLARGDAPVYVARGPPQRGPGRVGRPSKPT